MKLSLVLYCFLMWRIASRMAHWLLECTAVVGQSLKALGNVTGYPSTISMQGRGQGGSDDSDEPPFQKQNFFKLKTTPNLTALELSGSYFPTGTPLYYS